MLKQKFLIMKLEVFISKKGTKVVRATNLHAVLQLSNEQYLKNIRKWLKEVYEFNDGIRQPCPMRDFAKKPASNPVVEDYYITVELAKLITLASSSKVKRKYADQLRSLEKESSVNEQALSPEEVKEVLTLAQKMKFISNQTASERQHMERYRAEHGTAANWWNYREEVLGYTSSFWRDEILSDKELAKGLSQRELLLNVDQTETIRAGVVDYYMAVGKEKAEAKKLGDLAKIFADELGLQVTDDRNEIKPTPGKRKGARVRDIKQNQQVLWAS